MSRKRRGDNTEPWRTPRLMEMGEDVAFPTRTCERDEAPGLTRNARKVYCVFSDKKGCFSRDFLLFS